MVGILVACVINVVQSSRTSAIRGIFSGTVATSTVRRELIQQRYLEQAGCQTQLVRLSGILFFGTIVAVEKQIKRLVDESFKKTPIRYLIFDLSQVDGVDSSAKEALGRMIRMLRDRDVVLCLCGCPMSGKVYQTLKAGKVMNGEVEYYEKLNDALEKCENGLLQAFYGHQAAAKDVEAESTPTYVDVLPNGPKPLGAADFDMVYGSPRRDHLHHIASSTLAELSPPATLHGEESHPQPLRILLEVFRHVSPQDACFWSKAAPYFIREDHAAGEILYRSGEPPSTFYIVASGMLRAKYDMEQGDYTEVIVEGTTCGELPFFSNTARTSTTIVDKDSTCWVLTREKWDDLEEKEGVVAIELLKIALALTKERMDNNIKHVLLQTG